MVLRGGFTPSTGSAGEIEWCDRVLLARIHRLTLGRMRREIEPVSPVEFMSFLLSWQHVGVNRPLEGRDGVLHVIQQLQGLELPAPGLGTIGSAGACAELFSGGSGTSLPRRCCGLGQIAGRAKFR